MNEATSKMDKATKIKWICLIMTTVIILLIPKNDTYSLQIAEFLAITIFCIGMLCLDIAPSVFLPGLLMPFAYLILQLAPAATIYSPWLGSTPYMMFSAYLLAYALEDCGLIKRLSYFGILKSGGSYMGICMAILVVGFISSLMTSCNVCMVMIAIAAGVSHSLKFPTGRHSAGLYLAAALGTLSCEQFMYYPPPMGVLSAAIWSVDPEAEITWLGNLIHCWPIAIYMFVFMAFYCKFMVPKIGNLATDALREEYHQLGKLSRQEIKALILIVGMLIMLVFAPQIGMDTAWPFIIISIVMFFPGINLCDATSVRRVPYEMPIFIASCMSIGGVASALGINVIVGELLTPVFSNFSGMGLVAILYVIVAVVNLLLTPLAIDATLAPVVCQILTNMGMDPHFTMYVFLFGSDAIIFPYEHVNYLMMFSFGLITMKDFIRIWLTKLPFHFAGVMLLVVPYWYLIGLL